MVQIVKDFAPEDDFAKESSFANAVDRIQLVTHYQRLAEVAPKARSLKVAI